MTLPRKRKIAMDLGHGYSNTASGGFDPGAVAAGQSEHKLLEPWFDALVASLKKNNQDVLVIKDMRVGLRDDRAKAWGADMMFSWHMNAGGGTGTEVIIHRFAGLAFNRKATRTGKAIAAALGLTYRGTKRDWRGLALTGPYGQVHNTAIVEVCFIDSAKDRAAFATNGTKARVAAALVIVDRA